ncbi:MAG: hypothetical protein N2489_02995 [Clostridia bacterium]|nr:hypothetical protein [Clostridia bacterium]
MSNEEFQSLVLKKLAQIHEEVANLKTDVASLDARMSKLECRFDKFEERLERLENKFDDLEVKNAQRHQQLEAKIDYLIEDNKSIHEILGEHEVSIRSLRRRPV